MSQKVDLLITGAAEIATCAGEPAPFRGKRMGDPGLISDGSIAVDDGRIVAVGSEKEIRATYTGRQELTAGGRAIVPGFVDAHTHTVFGGDRVDEFEMRIAGAGYMEIMAAGGGIVSTVAQTRTASEKTLRRSAARRLKKMLALGTTTVEIKSGYGLDTESELKMLRVIEQLDRSQPVDLVPTFLGAHTLPEEYKHNAEGYVTLILEEMIPAVAEWYRSSRFSRQEVPLFIDVFCEDHAFNPVQTGRILSKGRNAGMGVKIHVDQFHELGGVEVALDHEAVSVDHLEVTGEEGANQIARHKTVAVLLPAVNFNLGLTTFAPARPLIEAGAAVALATDLNPGSAPCFSLPLVMAIACRYLRMTPAEALVASTINAAHAVGLGDRVGSIEAGKQADLLFLKSDDYRDLTYFLGDNPVEAVIKRGKIV